MDQPRDKIPLRRQVVTDRLETALNKVEEMFRHIELFFIQTQEGRAQTIQQTSLSLPLASVFEKLASELAISNLEKHVIALALYLEAQQQKGIFFNST
jgi:hypothetical protein